MLIYYGVCIAILGLLFGSFLNCTAMRIVRKEDFVKGRSHCMSCGHELTARDLVPVFSYLVHRGRCRHCGAKVSVRYPVSELGFMLLSIGLYIGVMIYGLGTPGVGISGLYDIDIWYITGFTSERILFFFEYWFLTGCLYIAALADLESLEIPDGVLLAGAISWVVFSIGELLLKIVSIKWLLHHFLAGLLIGAVMLVLSIVMDRVLGKDSMGGGDIKLYSLLGLYLGYIGSYELVLLSCIVGLLFAGIRKAALPDAPKEFPFGPSIAFAGYILLLVGNNISDWYLSLFL